MNGAAQPGAAALRGEELFEYRFTVAATPAAAFALIADPLQLDALTPRWFRYRGPKAAPVLAVGARVDARIRWRLLPFPWQSRITCWQPPQRFDYEQIRGPYGKFVHEHHVQRVDGGVEVLDRVRYRLPGGGLGAMVRRLAGRLVAADLRRLFAHRERAVRRALGPSHREAPQGT